MKQVNPLETNLKFPCWGADVTGMQNDVHHKLLGIKECGVVFVVNDLGGIESIFNVLGVEKGFELAHKRGMFGHICCENTLNHSFSEDFLLFAGEPHKEIIFIFLKDFEDLSHMVVFLH